MTGDSGRWTRVDGVDWVDLGQPLTATKKIVYHEGHEVHEET